MTVAVRIEVNIDSLDGINRQLDAVVDGIHDLIQTAEDAWGAQATEAMKEQHGMDAHSIQRYINRTWDLTESIGHNLEPVQGTNPVVHPIRIFAAAPYAFDVENGVPGRSQAYPFFWKEITSAVWRTDLDNTLTNGLNVLLASVAEKA